MVAQPALAAESTLAALSLELPAIVAPPDIAELAGPAAKNAMKVLASLAEIPAMAALPAIA